MIGLKSKIIVIVNSFGHTSSIGLSSKRNVDGLALISPFAIIIALGCSTYNKKTLANKTRVLLL
jgi:hypothetical protein